MQEIKIEKQIPITKKNFGEQRVSYPFDKMEIGDSFWVECPSSFKSGASFQSSILSTARLYSQYNKKDMKFTSRQEDVDGKKGVRLWRVK